MIQTKIQSMLDHREELSNPKHRDILQKLLDDVHVFVFSPLEKEELDEFEGEIEELDLPFPVCFFQQEEHDDLLYSFASNKNHMTSVRAALVHEIRPTVYEYFVLVSFKREDISFGEAFLFYFNEDNPKNNSHSWDEEDWKNNKDMSRFMIRKLLERLRKEEIGTIPINDRIKLKIGDKKKVKKIRQVIYVTKRKNTGTIQSRTRGQIDWSHAWEVRGHWRRIGDSTGHDREGNAIQGFTWIRPFQKGKGELVKKIRIVKS